jgi:hypothetical protein
MAISTYNVHLKWGESIEAAVEVVPIKDFPDLIGDPNLLETTTLSDIQATNIPGIRTSDLLTFTCNFDKATFEAVYAQENTDLTYVLEFSDGSKFTWEGRHTCGVPGKGVDEVIEFTVNVTSMTPVTFVTA